MARTLLKLKAEPLLHAQNIINGALCDVQYEGDLLALELEGQAFVDSLRVSATAERILWHAFDYVEGRIESECMVRR